MMCLLTLKVHTALILDYLVISTTAHVMERCVLIGKEDSVVHAHYCFVQNEKCIAFGPGKDMFDSTRIIGEKQYTLGKVTEVYSTSYYVISAKLETGTELTQK